jgi:PAP2 superfamily
LLVLQETQAAALAVGLGAAGLGVPRLPLRSRPRWLPAACAGLREAAVVFGLFAVWQYVGARALTRVAGAFDRARDILTWERAMHLPSELSVQHLVLPYAWLVRGMNTFYLYVHINSIAIFLVWMFVRHRNRYAWARNTLVLVTGICLLVQMVPVAPPRMLGSFGFVDTANLYGQSIYGPFGSGIADQLSAMPSVHVAWAALIAFFVIRVSPSRWRWLILLDPILTVFVVVATANHYWLDGIVAIAILAAVLPVTAAFDRRRAGRGQPAEDDADLAPVAVPTAGSPPRT